MTHKNALKYFQEIIKQNPDTRRASSAQAYIDAINSGQDILDADENGQAPAGGGEEDAQGGSGEEPQSGNEEDEGSPEEDTGEGTALPQIREMKAIPGTTTKNRETSKTGMRRRLRIPVLIRMGFG